MDKKFYVTPEMEELKLEGELLMLNESDGGPGWDDDNDF